MVATTTQNLKRFLIVFIVFLALFSIWKLSVNQLKSPQTVTPINPREQNSLNTKSGSLYCTIPQKVGGEIYGGKLYVGDQGYYRSEVTLYREEKLTANFMILKDQMVYIWSNDRIGGIKYNTTASVNESSASASFEGLRNTEGIQCVDWTQDLSVFEPPSDIEFVDISPLFDELQKQQDLDCQKCDEEKSPEEINLCKRALNCK